MTDSPDGSIPKTLWRCAACRQLNFGGQATCRCGFAYGSSPPKHPARIAPLPLADSVRPGLIPPADTADVRDVNPFVSIWLHPRATIRHIISTDATLYVAWLLIIGAFFESLDRASSRDMGDRAPMWVLIILSLVLAPLAVPLSHLAAMIGRWAGAKLGGVATREEVRASIAWASVPVIAGGLVFWPMQLVLFGDEMFRSETPLMAQANPFVLLGALSLPIIPAVWAVFTGAKTFAEVHQFSAWRAVGAALLVVGAIVVPILALLVVLYVAGPTVI